MRSVLLVAMLLLGCTRIDGPQPSPVDPVNPPASSKESRLSADAFRSYALAMATEYESLATIQESSNPLTPRQMHDRLITASETARRNGWKQLVDDDAVVFADKYDPKLHAIRLRRMAAGVRSAVK